MQAIVAFVSGVMFAVGLALGGMTLPSKVIGFLDFFGGQWDPSLAFVMGGAVTVYTAAYLWSKRRSKPVITQQFMLPKDNSQIDGRLLGGAAIFGVGWGLGGFCPGPGVVSSTSLGASALAFTASMVLGMLVFRVVSPLWSKAKTPVAPPKPAKSAPNAA